MRLCDHFTIFRFRRRRFSSHDGLEPSTPPGLFLRRTAGFEAGIARDIAGELVGGFVVPRVHLVLDLVLEVEFAALDLSASGGELGSGESHGFEESDTWVHRISLSQSFSAVRGDEGDVLSFHSTSFRFESHFSSAAMISMTLGKASSAAWAFKNASRVLLASTSMAVCAYSCLTAKRISPSTYGYKGLIRSPRAGNLFSVG